MRGDTRASAVAPAETRKSHQAGNVLISGEAAEAEATRWGASGTLAPNLMLDKQFLAKILFQHFFGNQKFIAETITFVLAFVFSIRQDSSLPAAVAPHQSAMDTD